MYISDDRRADNAQHNPYPGNQADLISERELVCQVLVLSSCALSVLLKLVALLTQVE
jgi:hypothetical protein